MTNLMMAKGGDILSNNYGKGVYLDAAFGYFRPFNRHFVFEVYSGFGGCNQHHQYDDTTSSDLSFTKVFLQPSFGLTFSVFDVAVTTGVGRITFNRIHHNVPWDHPESFMMEDIAYFRSYSFFEPSLTIRGGWKYVKVQLQYVSSMDLSRGAISYAPSHGSIGLAFAFAERFRKGW